MPTRIAEAKRFAREQAALLGHDIGPFRSPPGKPNFHARAQCRNCKWYCGLQHDIVYSNGWHLKPCEGAPL